MKHLSETKALERLQEMKDEYAALIRETYEHRAKSCLTCDTKGACCVDEHFVNVHITRLEATAIRRALARLPMERQDQIYARVEKAIDRYGLDLEGDSFAKTYACPLFEREIGCLVHSEGKPLPCISHACYEKPQDLPPDDLQTDRERQVEVLNRAVYGEPVRWLPLPVAIRRKNVL